MITYRRNTRVLRNNTKNIVTIENRRSEYYILSVDKMNRNNHDMDIKDNRYRS